MRYLTPVAEAAKLVRKELKQTFPYVKFKVRSSNFSMGDDINVYYDAELTADQIDTLHDILKKYQYGSFDGMTDYYENDNLQDFPQTKYIFANKVSNLENY